MPDNEIKLITASQSFLNWPKCLAGGALLILTGVLLIFLGAFSTAFDLLVVVAGLGLITRAAIVVANANYFVTNHRVIAVSGMLNKRTAEAQLAAITGISVRRDPIQETLGLGDLVIECAGGPILFEGVEEPEKLRERILALK
jgi:uncharacterized membrane protein YdbT with pleckstrin-like domain